MKPDADRIARKSLLLGNVPKPAQDLILATARERAFDRGDSFGEAVAFTGGVYPVSAEAASDVVLVRIETAEILRLIERQPGLAVSLLAATFAHPP
ncbi:hypothetical protein AP071_16765 [Rhodobacter capsulatus]|nr:hypothetical protein AP071_16765 [Rhodobacter capsulatus]